VHYPRYILYDAGITLAKSKYGREAIPPWILNLRNCWSVANQRAHNRILAPPNTVCMVCGSVELIDGSPIELCAFCMTCLHPSCADAFDMDFQIGGMIADREVREAMQDADAQWLQRLLEGRELTLRADFKLPDFFIDTSE
jgi:hypothetical protein